MINPFRVEICGGMASGKTTFASLFSDSANLILEDFTAVPFWRAFFDHPGSFNLETELSFLLQHYHQVKRTAIETKGKGILFCDFSFVLDRAYAAVSLAGSQRQAFASVQDEVLSEVGSPKLIVYLQCSAEIELRRIQARQRSAETEVTRDFLGSLNIAVDREVAALTTPIEVVRLDSDTQDFALDMETRNRCRERVLTAISELMSGASSQLAD